MTKNVFDFYDACLKQRKSIGVVGDVAVDEYYDVSVERISPEHPIPVLSSLPYFPPISRPGCAGNVVCQFLDTFQVNLYSVLNSSANKIFQKHNINVDFCVDTTSPITPIKKRFYSKSCPLFRWDVEGEYPKHRDIDSVSKSLQDNHDFYIYSDYNKGLFPGFKTKHLEKAIVDPKTASWDYWKGCRVIKPNAKEAALFSQEAFREDQCRFFLNRGCQSVVITASGRGYFGQSKEDGYFEHSETPSEAYVESAGAGDCYAAFLAMALSHDFSLPDACRLAHMAGKLYVLGRYNQPVLITDLLKHEDPAKAKFYLPDGFKGKVVFTNGCFDVLHIGHIKLLEYAKSLGDVLIVALNTDESVAKLKPGRPVNSLEDRMQFLASLSCVDYVVPFAEDTPYELIENIRPDILVKGNEGKTPVGANLVDQVVLFDKTGHSTTNIIQRQNS